MQIIRPITQLILVACAAVGLSGSLAHTQSPPADAVLELGFDESAGATVLDASGNGHVGTIAGASRIPQGKFGRALSFDGINDWVTVADSDALDLTAGMTLEAWVYPTAQSGGSWRNVVIKERAGGETYNLYAHTDTNTPAVFVIPASQPTLAPDVQGTAALPLASWTHLAATYDGAVLRLYVNGALVGSRVLSGALLTSTGVLRIGGNGIWGEFFQGNIDEVRIYNRELTPAELQVDMNTPINPSGPDVTAPDVALLAPIDGATVAGAVVLTAEASDNVGIAGVEFFIDAVSLGPEDTIAPYSISWDTTQVVAGSYALTARARDFAGNTSASSRVGVAVANTPVPANFQDEVVIGAGVTLPTALEFLPDGRLLVAEFTGRLLVAQPGASSLNADPVLELPNIFSEDATAGGERGLVNVVADPEFATNGHIYVFYTAQVPQRDRVSRFTMTGNTASPSSELVVWQGVANSTSTDHHGGGLAFGPDGKLYISTGDNGDPASSQPLSGDHGKILRVNKDGTVPTDNPFFDGSGPNLDAVWARGLRNPYRMSFDSASGRLYIGDVGFNTTEELNRGVAGANYGWPQCEGACGSAGITNPIFTYPHGGRDAAITGGFVYRGSQFPASYYGAYFYGDFAQNWIRYLTLDVSGNVTGGGNLLPADGSVDGPYDPVMLKPGPDGSLYYVDFGWGWQSTANPASIRRIRYVSGNQPPVAMASATPQLGPAPLSVSFSSAGSLDPEGQSLAFSWTFGDGATSNEANPTHIYMQPGAYAVQVAVSDGTNTTLSEVVGIAVGSLPAGTISSPADGTVFRAGDVLSFSGSGSDPDDGLLPANALTWTVLFHHDSHVHPAMGPVPGTGGTFTIPSAGHDFSGNTGYEIALTVTDSTGLQTTSSVFVFPEKVDLTFSTSPAGLSLTVDGIVRPTPYVKDTLVGFQHTIEAAPQVQNGFDYTFSSWSDGGGGSHGIIASTSTRSYVATFVPTALPRPLGLVAAYGFDEASGATTSDASGNNLTGTLSNVTRTTAGKFGSALSFNGVNAWVTVPDANPLDLTTGMTLEAWVHPTATGNGVWRNVLIKERTAGEVYNLYANVDTDVPAMYVATPSAVLDARGTAAVPLNTWTHLAATYDGTTLRLFVNGIQVGTRAVAGALVTSNGALRIGGNNVWGEFFQGNLDEIRIYNRALSATEITADMNTRVGGTPTVTVNQAAGQADPSNASPINFTAVFSVPVADFAGGDVSLGGTAGATTAVVTGGPTTYNIAVSGMTNNGTVTAAVGAGVAHDAAANGNAASTSTDNIVTFDASTLTVTIDQAAGQAGSTNASPINFTAVFSTAVADFATGDVTLGGTAGATTAVVSGGPTTYNIAVSGMTTSGTVIATVGAGVAHNAAQIANTASTSTDNTVTYDASSLPSLSISSVMVPEGDAGTADAIFTVTLSRASSQLVTVNYATANDTAAAPADYTAKSNVLTFPIGSTTQLVTVAVVGDTLDEASEQFWVNLTNPSGATISQGQGTATISDNDPPPSLSISNASVTEVATGTANATFTVTLSVASGQPVTVNYTTIDGTATAPADYTATAGTLTFPAGIRTQQIIVPAANDLLDENPETYTVSLSAASGATIGTAIGTGTINDNNATPSLAIDSVSVTEGNTGSITAAFTVTLSAVSGREVTVNYATANNTATAASGDYTAITTTPLTFAPGVTTRTINVSVVGDTRYEAAETFRVNLSSATNATIAVSQGTGTIVNDDTPPSLTISSPMVTETNSGSTTMTFVVSLSAASGVGTTVSFATADGTAVAGSDYTSRIGTLTIGAGSISGNIAITRFGDTIPEANETLFVDLNSPTNATIAQSRGTGTINDNDGTVTVTSPNTTVTWTVGSTRLITWTTSNNFTAGATFRVELSRDGGTTFELVAASVPNATATTGSYSWTVTGPATTQGRVRVTWTVNGRVTDISNTNFAIGP